MLAAIIKYGQVQSFKTQIINDVEVWSSNHKARSIRFTVQGDKAAPPAIPSGAAVKIISETVEEILYVGQSITFGGYNDLMRFEQYKFEFFGAGAKNMLIVQDVEITNPIYLIDGVERKVEFCD